jgi:hypothetical protein
MYHRCSYAGQKTRNITDAHMQVIRFGVCTLSMMAPPAPRDVLFDVGCAFEGVSALACLTCPLCESLPQMYTKWELSGSWQNLQPGEFAANVHKVTCVCSQWCMISLPHTKTPSCFASKHTHTPVYLSGSWLRRIIRKIGCRGVGFLGDLHCDCACFDLRGLALAQRHTQRHHRCSYEYQRCSHTICKSNAKGIEL